MLRRLVKVLLNGWLLAVVVSAAASWGLLHWVNAGLQGPGSPIGIAAVGPSSLARSAVIIDIISDRTNRTAVVIHYAGEHDQRRPLGEPWSKSMTWRVALPVAAATDCVIIAPSPQSNIKIHRILDTTLGGESLLEVPIGDLYQQGREGFVKAGTDLQCTLSKQFAERSFTTVGLDFATVPITATAGLYSIPISVNFSSIDASSVSFSGGSLAPGQDPNVERRMPAGLLHAEARIGAQLNLRDGIMVAIGALMGFSAACLLEWLRPVLQRARA